MDKVNIFDYATSELSQDAFICWFLAHATKEHCNEDKAITNCAREFVSKFYDIQPNECIDEIRRQYSNTSTKNKIDILVRIKEKFIIIEDKTYTGLRERQLEDYEAMLQKEQIKKENILTVLYMIAETPRKQGVNYCFDREKLIELFEKYENETDNVIFISYLKHLRKIDKEFKELYNEELINWKPETYFYMFSRITQDLKDVFCVTYNWKTSGASKSAILWWNPIKDVELEKRGINTKIIDDLYLQIENNTLQVRISIKDSKQIEEIENTKCKIKRIFNENNISFDKEVNHKRGNTRTIGYVFYRDEEDCKNKIVKFNEVLRKIKI